MADIGTSTVAYATRQTTGQLVFIASDGAAAVLWCDGTNQVIAYDDSSYASWTKVTHTTGLNMVLAGDFRAGTDNIDTVTGGTANVRGNYRLLTKSGATWTVGASNGLSGTTAIGVTAQGSPCVYAGQDAQGRHWIAVPGATNTVTTCYYSAANSPTTTGWTASGGVTQTSDLFTPAADQVGNYLVYIYWNGTALQWKRVDNSAASVGSWTTAATITGLTGSPNASSAVKFKAISATQGLLTYSSGSGIYAQLYTASSDTWGAATQLSSGANDRHPTIASDGTGKAWVIWCSYVASNNFALLYKKYNGSTWDAGATTLVASGTNINYPNVGFGAKTIGVTYTQGTASPYTVGWVTIPLGGSRAITGMSAALSGPSSLILYGSGVAHGTMTTAGAMTANTGGVETSTVTNFGSGGNFGEVYALGGSPATVAAIPTTPTGHGWAYLPGAGTFAVGDWSAIGTFAKFGGNSPWTMRFYQYTGSYTLIGTLTVTPTTSSKAVYTFSAASMGSVVFGASDLLYIDLWFQDATGAGGDSVTVYEATTSLAGVTSEMQITTAVWTPAAITSTRPISGVTAALQALNVEHPITGVSVATKALGIEKPISGVSASVSVPTTTYTRPITGVSAALQALGLTRPVVGVTSALQAVGLTRPVVGVSSALQAVGLTRPVVSVSVSLVFTGTRPVVGVSVALLASQITRPISSVSTSLLFTGMRPISGVTVATKAFGVERSLINVSGSVGAGGITRTIINVGAALQALNVSRPISGVSAATLQPGITRPITSVTTSLSVAYSRPITGVSAATLQPGITRPIVGISVSLSVTYTRPITGVSSALQAFGVPRNISSVSVAVGVGGLQRTIIGVTAATKQLGATRPISGVSAATIQVGLTRPIVGISVSVVLTASRPISGVSTALKALGVERLVVSVSAATKALGVSRPIAGVTSAVGQGGITRSILNVSVAVQAFGVSRNVTGVSSAVQAFGVTRSLVGVSGAVKQIGLTRDISGVSAALAQTVSRTVIGVTSAVQALALPRPMINVSSSLTLRTEKPVISVSSAVKALGVPRTVTGVLGAIGVAGLTRPLTNISASLSFTGKMYTYVTVTGARGNVTVEGTRGNVTVEGTRGTITVQEE